MRETLRDSLMHALHTHAVRQGLVLTSLALVGTLAGFLFRAMGEGELAWAGWGLAFLAGGVPAAREALRELVGERKLDVDLLMVLAALGAMSVGAPGDGAVLLFLFSLSNTLQDWAFTRTRGAIQSLMEMAPEGAWRLEEGGREQWVPLAELRVGDRIRVRPGERVAADARVILGTSGVDESALTGESVPSMKEPGSSLFGGTLNADGVLVARVERPASESALSRLIRLVEEAQTRKSPTETFAASLEGPYTLVVLLLVPVVFFTLYGGVGLGGAEAWYRAMTFLVVASPCAVVISTPASVLSAMAAAARGGVLFKSGAALEALARVRTLAFDKTGTLTRGEMEVVRFQPTVGNEAYARHLVSALEWGSEHPIGRALASVSEEPAEGVEEVRARPGLGIRGTRGGSPVWAGSVRLAQEEGADLAEVAEALGKLDEEGLTPVLVGEGTQVLGLFALADAARIEAVPALEELRAEGLRIAMMTGDRRAVAGRIAEELGIPEIYFELLPEDKLRVLEALQLAGPVAMVGDGINDAPALAAADLGISMGGASDVSLESADVVLMNDDLSRLASAIHLARRTAWTIRFNLLFALAIIVGVGILSLFGLVPLPVGVVAHEGGTLFVVAMGLRLLRSRVGTSTPRVSRPSASPSSLSDIAA